MTNRTRAANQQAKDHQLPGDKTQETFYGQSAGKKVKNRSKTKGKKSHNPGGY